MVATQHDCNTTWQQHNIVAAQNMVQALLDTDNSTKGKKVVDNNTSRNAATTVSKSVHD